eukprot:9272405-Heterocapsa_arctica.AAC.1
MVIASALPDSPAPPKTANNDFEKQHIYICIRKTHSSKVKSSSIGSSRDRPCPARLALARRPSPLRSSAPRAPR